MHADQEELHPWLAPRRGLLRELLGRGMPMLGVCLGAQLLAEAAGGDARRAREPEIGWFEVEVTDAGLGRPAARPAGAGFEAFQWHSYECGAPPEAAVLARSPVCLQAYRVGELGLGDPVPRRGDARPTPTRWIDDYRSRRGRGAASASTPRRCAAETARADRRLERARPRALRPLPRPSARAASRRRRLELA